MTERIETRLAELRRELQAGEEQLRELMAREAALRETLLRISGAVQVLAEILEPAPAPVSSPVNGADVLTVG